MITLASVAFGKLDIKRTFFFCEGSPISQHPSVHFSNPVILVITSYIQALYNCSNSKDAIDDIRFNQIIAG